MTELTPKQNELVTILTKIASRMMCNEEFQTNETEKSSIEENIEEK